MLEVGEHHRPEHCDAVTVNHSKAKRNKEEVDSLGRWPHDPVQLHASTRQKVFYALLLNIVVWAIYALYTKKN